MDVTLDASGSNQSSWIAVVVRHQNPHLWKSLWQILNSYVPFFMLWYLMYRSLEYSYGITLGLSIVAAGFLLRIFIIQHDCGHRAFFRSKKANDMIGFICGILTLTPYHHWRKSHALHHARAGNLDRRFSHLVSDSLTLTVKEYLGLPRWKRLKYRFYRHPVILFGLGPLVYFIIAHRFPYGTPWSWKQEWLSVCWTNVALVVVTALVGLCLGFREVVMIQLPTFYLAAIAGLWIFYIQHQFEETYWVPHAEWDYVRAAMQGSSYYKLPRILQWFTGNIGLHHIHHLSSKIPNYHLQPCHDAYAMFQQVPPLTFWQSLKCASLKLWDEDRGRLVRFRDLKGARGRQEALAEVGGQPG
jgi:omega-6 fatty acid desaturase (delta-12 desaturase)